MAAIVTVLVVAGVFATIVFRVTETVRSVSIREVLSGSDESALRTSDPEFSHGATLTEVTLVPGHRVEVLADTLLFSRLFADLSAARRSITFLGYYCEPGRLGDRVAEVLTERARAGVAVLFVGDDFGCSELLDEIEDTLESAGVRVARFRPVRWHSLPRAQHRLHARSVVIDGEVGYTGGFGISDKWAYDTPDEPRWRDTGARFTGAAVAEMQAMFVGVWAEATGELLTSRILFPARERPDQVWRTSGDSMARTPRGDTSETRSLAPTAGDGPDASANSIEGALAGFLYSRTVMGATSAERYIASTLATASRSAYVTNSYFVPTQLVLDLLIDAARRGVDVRLLLPDEHTDIPSTRRAGHSFYQELLAAGVRIFEYQPSMIHAKTLVVDGHWSAVGTLNLDNRSLRLNDESALLIDDPRTGAVMDSLFFADLEDALEITLESHQARPLRERMLEWLARRIAPLL